MNSISILIIVVVNSHDGVFSLVNSVSVVLQVSKLKFVTTQLTGNKSSALCSLVCHPVKLNIVMILNTCVPFPYLKEKQITTVYHKKNILKCFEQSVAQKSNLHTFGLFFVKLQYTRSIGQFWMKKIRYWTNYIFCPPGDAQGCRGTAAT